VITPKLAAHAGEVSCSLEVDGIFRIKFEDLVFVRVLTVMMNFKLLVEVRTGIQDPVNWAQDSLFFTLVRATRS
jgi:hypothetical protein